MQLTVKLFFLNQTFHRKQNKSNSERAQCFNDYGICCRPGKKTCTRCMNCLTFIQLLNKGHANKVTKSGNPSRLQPWLCKAFRRPLITLRTLHCKLARGNVLSLILFKRDGHRGQQSAKRQRKEHLIIRLETPESAICINALLGVKHSET